MLTPSELENASMLFDEQMKNMETEVMEDVIRRIQINSHITSSADWQLYRLFQLGESKRVLKKIIKSTLKLDKKEINHLYKDVIRRGYERDSSLYRTKGKPFIPFDKNEQLQQYINAVAVQTSKDMYNLTQSLGFAERKNNKIIFKPIAEFYQDTLDNAVNGIANGAFDYNTALKKAVKTMTDSGLRTVDYETGHTDRIDVAARRAVMTGMTQITAKINDENAKKLDTNMFEVSWHSGARLTHQVWQGRWYSENDLSEVCGLGSVTGLCGANCYHSYSPVIPGISVPTYTEEELAKMNEEENIPVEYNGKEYTKYEALQKQRYLERKMRTERQKIKLLKDGGADEEDIINARCRYRGTSQEYTDFSKAMNLPQQRERVTIDGLGNIGAGKYKNTVKTVEKSKISDIIELKSKGKNTISMNINYIELPIEQRNTGKGNPNAVLMFGVELNNRQKKLLEQLPHFDSRIIVPKKSAKMTDLAALTAQTGHEFAMFTKGNERLIIRGNSRSVNIDIETAKQMADQGYRWSGHTHPGISRNCLFASDGDKLVLKQFKQNISVIYNSKGQYATFEKE